MFVDKISYKKKHLHACSPSTISVSKFILSTAPVSKYELKISLTCILRKRKTENIRKYKK